MPYKIRNSINNCKALSLHPGHSLLSKGLSSLSKAALELIPRHLNSFKLNLVHHCPSDNTRNLFHIIAANRHIQKFTLNTNLSLTPSNLALLKRGIQHLERLNTLSLGLSETSLEGSNLGVYETIGSVVACKQDLKSLDLKCQVRKENSQEFCRHF